ncbi:MAG: thiol:disulfide interchange protein DsbA/DsbL [Gammaproteobacteria bacterium]|nr:thiol:disulfide interchange protein DsbA/DsbL [Gammaproteobacteria bacterium]
MNLVWIKRMAFLLLVLPLTALAKEYSEDKHYSTLFTPQATQSADKIEVLEFFWYGCPHCYRFEPALSRWVKNKPANVHFERVPAPLNPKWMPHTKTYYALELMGKGEQYHEPLFEALHVKKQRLFTMDEITDFLVKQGVDKKAFSDAVNSFAVEMRARRAMQIGKAYKLNGVPALAINGKYTVSASQAGSYDEMINITSYLISKEAK